MKYAGRILVEDASGCQFEIHQYRKRLLFSYLTRFALDTGEEVKRLDRRTFVVTTTGEKLSLIDI